MRKDPECLPTDASPALVQFRDGVELFCATHATQESGWLWVEFWDGTRRTLPPQRIKFVEPVETVLKHDAGDEWQEVKDAELVERARREAEPDENYQPIVADGGEQQ